MDPRDPYSAGAFARQAREIARRLLSEGKLPILCGGTGFYVRAFFEGLFEGPGRDDAFRHALGASEASRPGTLKRMIDLLDPESGQRILAGDAARAIRYLEIAYASGRRPSDLFRERPGERWELPAVKILLTLPRSVLYERIRQRFHGSMAGSLPSEVEKHLAGGLPATAPGMSAIGYRETVDLLGGRIDRLEWEERVIGATRRFAKRQETWFRREAGVVPVPADHEGLVGDILAASEFLFS